MIGESALPQTQGRAEWVRQRIGCLTGSRMSSVLVYTNKGGFRRASSTVRDKYSIVLVAERMIDGALNHFVTDAMQHGIDHEPDAIAEYERTRHVKVLPSEFIQHPSIEHFGGTPDGLVGSDGGLETKAPTTVKYATWRLSSKPPEEHVPQIASYLSITGRRYWDLAAYDPRVKKGPRLTVWRYEPSGEDLEIVAEEARLFLQQVELIFRQVTET